MLKFGLNTLTHTHTFLAFLLSTFSFQISLCVEKHDDLSDCLKLFENVVVESEIPFDELDDFFFFIFHNNLFGCMWCAQVVGPILILSPLLDHRYTRMFVLCFEPGVRV